MKRWRGWGLDNSAEPVAVKSDLRSLLEMLVGSPTPLPVVTLEEVITSVPASRLDPHPLINTTAETRVRHARGQSLPDWLAMRSGDIGVFPDGVATPQSAEQVRELLDYAAEHNIAVIPYGGGTSVAGHINPDADERALLTIDMGDINTLMHLDQDSLLATFGAGAAGPRIEAQLAQHGYTLGHYPQSWELSTAGGWVASRSSGQQSLHYGRIEQLFAGGRMETMNGTLDIPCIPASSAGPDVREMVLGSEGRMGIITEVTLRVSPQPEEEHFKVVFLDTWETGLKLAKALVQARIALSMMRLSNPLETASQLAMGRDDSSGESNPEGVGMGHVMLTMGATGSVQHCLASLGMAHQVCAEYGAIEDTNGLGDRWFKGRFHAPYLREPLGDAGYAVDTMETAVNWSSVADTAERVERAITTALDDDGEKVLAYSHLSHVYRQGSSIYTTYVFRPGASYAEALARWQKIKGAGASEIVACGGTISHQHGVGRDHRDYMGSEKGALGLAAIDQLCKLFDPRGQMNPGALLPPMPDPDER
ncbi:MAG: FAD-binding oxidoreductase [Porticoccaceae bacterium]|nr:FAD-binding oxidoreductase [Porticoccaceae bacterium]